MRSPLLLTALLCTSTSALALRPFTPEELLQTRRLDDVQLSPDGRWASFTVRQKSLGENRDLKDVWVAPYASAGTPRPITRDGKSEHARWSPDGRALLVTSARSGEAQLWLFDVQGLSNAPGDPPRLTGGDPQKLTNLWGGAEGGLFSPDGKNIAFMSEVYPQCNGDDLCNRKHAEELEGAKVKARLESSLFVRHWNTWRDGKRQHVFTLTLAPMAQAGATPLLPFARDLTPGDADWPTWRLSGGEDLAFSPDSKELVVSHKPAGRAAFSTNSDLYRIPVTGGEPTNLTAANTGDDAQPRFSPDGKFLAWLSQARDGCESDEWKVKLLDRRTGQVKVIGDFGDSPDSIAWRKDGKAVVATVLVKGRFQAKTCGLDGKLGLHATQTLSPDLALAADGSMAFVKSGMNRPPELYRLANDQLVRLTAFNQEQYAGLELGPAPEELTVDANDGARIQTWILKPPGLAKGQKAPLVVLVHGGPQGAWEDLWGMRWNPTVWAARGFVVLMPNVRGSTGYGAKFVEQISRDWGGLVYDDLMRTVDAAEKLPFVQAGKACAAGASFGGYMVDWLAGHTDRFKCLVTHSGVFDLRSMYGATEELWFPEFEFGGPYWEKPEEYAKWSPSSYVSAFKTPTLVIQGELDFRVPAEQGLQMFTALQRRGIESKLLWFPDEGHWVNKPKNSQLWHHTVLDWVAAHLQEPRR